VPSSPFKPTPQQLADARGKTVPDLIAPHLRVLFCGINPGLYSAATRHHFARPGNRFWPALHLAGFTPRVISPFDERELLDLGLGITNVVARGTASADELTSDELRHGAKRLDAKVRRFTPKFLAVLGVGAYRAAFDRPTAKIGLQDETLGPTRLWVLPNPSGLNAHFQLADLGRLLRELKTAADAR
jgi:double-stranded uracil-DNA glycosylase